MKKPKINVTKFEINSFDLRFLNTYVFLCFEPNGHGSYVQLMAFNLFNTKQENISVKMSLFQKLKILILFAFVKKSILI